MGSFSNYFENAVLNYIFRKGLLEQPTISLGLCTAAPDDTSEGNNCNELTAVGAYTRVTTVHTDWKVAVGGLITNAKVLTFAVATADWNTVTHFVFLDSHIHGTGHVLMWGEFDVAFVVNLGETKEFAADEFHVTLD